MAASPRAAALEQGLRVWAEVDLDRIEANLRVLRAQAGDARVLAVVKGNAYGHGATAVAKAAMRAGAWGLGVIGVDEGELLRRNGVSAPILVLGSSEPPLAGRIIEVGLRAVVGSRESALALAAAARAAGKAAIVHVKVETGLNRFGLDPDGAAALAEELRRVPGITVEGISSHLASVDEGDLDFTMEQYAAFQRCAESLPWVPLRHIASTGGLLDVPGLRLNMVRIGIGLYGHYPNGEERSHVALLPALALRSRVARVQELEPGQTVGYARTWTAGRPSRIATVMAGYADGIRRVLSNRGSVLVGGCRAPITGRVAMDMLMSDVTDIPGVSVGDEVTLIGEQDAASISAEEIASLSDTISYEVLTGIMARVARLYVQGGRLTAVEDLAGYREMAPL